MLDRASRAAHRGIDDARAEAAAWHYRLDDGSYYPKRPSTRSET
jgi:hypothetical protein